MIQEILLDTAPVLDPTGECGSLVHYGFVLAFVGGAFLVFLYLWKKNKLDMDEEPKHKMFKEDSNEPGKRGGDDGKS